MAVEGKIPGKRRASSSSSSSTKSSSPNKKSDPGRHPLTIFTIGHSTRPVDEFIASLSAHGIRQLADVRTIPRSRHNPQFGQDQLAPALEQAGIHYLHIPALGGLRHARRDSINTAWRNASFRGYADYMQTQPFTDSLEKLIADARKLPTAVMCAEAVPWRCHRSLIADALLVRGIDAREIASSTRAQPHKLTPFAHVSGTTITYPGIEGTSNQEKPAPLRGRRSSKTG